MDVRSFYGTRRRVAERCTTVSDALNKATATANAVSTVVLPPAAGDSAVDSDTEQVPDDMLNESPFETAGEFEVEQEVDDEEVDEGTSVNTEDVNVTATTSTAASAPEGKRRKKNEKEKQWKKSSRFDSPLEFVEMSDVSNSYPLLCGKSPVDIWRLFFDDDIIRNLVEQTSLYAHRDKNCPEFEICAADLLKFFGIILLSGYNTLPEEAHYWSNQPDLGVQIVVDAMSSKQFYTIKRFFHIADNEQLVQANKAAKVLPLYKALNENFVQFSIWHSNLSIDESMVPYYGRHSIKMFIKAKPIRFGYKVWCLCGIDGFPYHMKIYTGKEEKTDEPLGTRVVKHMVEIIERHSHVQHHQIFFDNFFTSYQLMHLLATRNVRAVGTVRENRTAGANCKLQSTKDLKAAGRGSCDSVCDGVVFVLKWADSAVVSLASNYLTDQPMQQTTRHVKGSSNVTVPQPHIVRKYNESMGGVDLLDRLLSSYRPMIRGKKWWWPLFLNALNVSVVAAWRLHSAVCSAPERLDHLTFRRHIVMHLLKGSHCSDRRQVGGGQQAHLPDELRFDGVGHVRVTCSQGRCRICLKNTRCKCVKCNARLHTDKGKDCFSVYHTPPC